MTDTELILKAISELKAELKTEISELRTDMENRFDIVEEKLTDMDGAISVITDWVERAADHNRIPFLEAK